MFDLPSLMLFVVASWVLSITPGPDSLYVFTRSIVHGKQAGIVSALGVTVAFSFTRWRPPLVLWWRAFAERR